MTRLLLCLAILVPLAGHATVPLAGTSFETASDLEHFTGTGLEIVNDRGQFGASSLKWRYGSGEVMEISHLQPLSPEQSGAVFGSHFPYSSTFVMSIYNSNPIRQALRIEFGNGAYFELNLGFRGWRTVWVPYHEMEGNIPRSGLMQSPGSVRFIAPDSAGSLWFDDIVFSQFIDDRHPYPGLEVPFIKEGGAHVWDHWMPKIPHWARLEALPPVKATAAELADLEKVQERLVELYRKEPPRKRGIDYFRERLSLSKPLKLRKQVDPIRYEQALGGPADYVDLGDFGKTMLQLANQCLAEDNDQLIELFMNATAYYLDQGWAAGSSQGTAHHVGYRTRELHTSFFLMRDLLSRQRLLDAVGDSTRWQLNFGETLDPEHLESNLDYYNTQSAFRLMASFLADDPAMQAAYLRTYAMHLTRALALTSSQGFRADGTAWHHWGHYPAYATGALDRIPISLKLLSDTSFRVGEAGHANFKRAFLAATIYSNPVYYGLGQAGRHPLGGNINKLQDACLALALAGTPDRQQTIDPDVASTYVRLWGEPAGRQFAGLALDTAPPNGHWTFPLAALSVHRRDDWSVNIKGYNKYVWASEIYRFDNRYGRYQSSGVVQILPNMTPEDAGYTEDGWDWNHPPGATTIERPFIELEPEGMLVMFKSDETYAGGCSLGGHGVWAMKLNESAGFTIDPVKKPMSFPGNLKARKSVFSFGRQLLCLGSGIEATDPSAPVHTTLFQNRIRQIDDTVYQHGNSLLLDPIGNGYRILDGSKVELSVGEQTSPNNKYSLRQGEGKKGASANASGLFVKAWIDHGPAPKKGAYAYAAFPMVGNLDRIAEFSDLEILRQDNAAHIVEDPESKTTAYACFESGLLEVGLLESVSVPCFVMLQKRRTLQVAVANPDLNQEEDPVKGHYNGDSREAPVTLRLKGRWKLKGAAEAWTEADGASTVLTVKCVNGMSMEVELEVSNDQASANQTQELDANSSFSGNGYSDSTIHGGSSAVADL